MQKSDFFLHFFVYLGRLCHKKSGPRLGFPPLNYTPYTNYSKQNYTLKGIFLCRTIHFIPNRVQRYSSFLIYANFIFFPHFTLFSILYSPDFPPTKLLHFPPLLQIFCAKKLSTVLQSCPK